MLPPPVVPDFNVMKNDGPELGLCAVAAPIEPLLLEATEPRLNVSIVVAVASPGHAWQHSF